MKIAGKVAGALKFTLPSSGFKLLRPDSKSKIKQSPAASRVPTHVQESTAVFINRSLLDKLLLNGLQLAHMLTYQTRIIH